MPYKKGGGEKQQLYDKNNGEYIRNPICEEDEENLIMIKLFGIDTKKDISYPIVGIHDKDYCELVVKYCLQIKQIYISNDKITNYLLIPELSKDKSKILNLIGYDITNWEELLNQIIVGTDFKKKKLKDFNDKKFTINAETKIWDKIYNRYYFCTTAWFIEKDFSLRFITLIPEVYKNE